MRVGDLFGFGDTETIHKLFGGPFVKKLWCENLPLGQPWNDGRTAIVHTMFQISKKIQEEGENL